MLKELKIKSKSSSRKFQIVDFTTDLNQTTVKQTAKKLNRSSCKKHDTLLFECQLWLMILLQFVWTNFALRFEPFSRSKILLKPGCDSTFNSFPTINKGWWVEQRSFQFSLSWFFTPARRWSADVRHCRRMRASQFCFVMDKWCWVRRSDSRAFRTNTRFLILSSSHQLCLARAHRSSTNLLARARRFTKLMTDLL